MSNHVRNVLKFTNLKTKDRAFILENFTKDKEYDTFPLNLIFDCDKIIPEPRVKEDCPKDCIVNEYSHVEEDADRPWFNWYKWRNRYWGTKWGAYDGYTILGTSTITFVFSTAWSAPLPVYEELQRLYPNLVWEVRFADEDYGCNCGKIIYNPDKTGFADSVFISERDLANPDAFARRIWRN